MSALAASPRPVRSRATLDLAGRTKAGVSPNLVRKAPYLSPAAQRRGVAFSDSARASDGPVRSEASLPGTPKSARDPGGSDDEQESFTAVVVQPSAKTTTLVPKSAREHREADERRMQKVVNMGGSEAEFARFNDFMAAADPDEDMSELTRALANVLNDIDETVERHNTMSNMERPVIQPRAEAQPEVQAPPPPDPSVTRHGSKRARTSFDAAATNFSRASVKKSDWKQPNSQFSRLERRQSKIERKRDLAQNVCKSCNHGALTYIAAAKNCHVKCLTSLQMLDKHQVKEAPPLDCRDGFGATALHFAARNGNLDMIQWLVENNFDLMAEARNGATAAHDAAATGRLKCLQCLVFHEPALATAAIHTDELLPIHLAAMFNKGPCLAWLIEQQHSHPMVPSSTGNTALHYAAGRGHFEVVDYLLSKISEDAVDLVNDDGLSALYRAAEDNRVEVFELLLEAGAEQSIREDKAEAIHYAARCGALDVIKSILQKDPKRLEAATVDGASPLHYAAAAGQEEVVRFLLRQWSALPPDSAKDMWLDALGNTPVHDAAANGNLNILEVMSEMGIPLDEMNLEGMTPSDVARVTNHSDVAVFLTIKGE
eukprot:m.66744 g.66744  ORF g.66744 m.66744 type:complete len:601 (-) comp7641_c0_seq2:1290-3092(-)